MSRALEFYVVDILIAADKVKRYTANFDNAESFLHSELEWDAVIRELEIIGEATKNLLKNDFIDKQYQSIVDFRNHIVHGYFGVDENIVWEVVIDLLEPFTQKLLNVVKQKNLDIGEAVSRAKEDYSFSVRTVTFLEQLGKTVR